MTYFTCLNLRNTCMGQIWATANQENLSHEVVLASTDFRSKGAGITHKEDSARQSLVAKSL
jgi:hypothetical protein